MAAVPQAISVASRTTELQGAVTGTIRNRSSRGRVLCTLLLFCVLVFGGCAQSSTGGGGDADKQPTNKIEKSEKPNTGSETTESASKEKDSEKEKSKGVQSPIKVEEGNPSDIPDFKGWDDKGEAGEPIQLETAGSAGAIPAVKPFNFGRDPGGPEDKTLYLTVPKIGLEDVPIYDSTSEEALTKSAIHVPATGFPWQEGANTYIAGHRLGYPDTGSFEIFFDLNLLEEGDEITVTDSAGDQYVYNVTLQEVVGLENVEVMNPVEDKSVVTLQTCTLPDYRERIIVQGDLVDSTTS